MNFSGALQTTLQKLLEEFCADDPGRSAALYTDHQKVGLLAVKGDVPRPAASVIKVPLLMALYDASHAGLLSLGQRIPVSALTSTRYASIMSAFNPDTELTLKELAALALITSDNPIAVHLTSLVRLERVNAVLARCGCSKHASMAAGFGEGELGPANRVNQLTAHDAIFIFRTLARHPPYEPLVVALANNLRNNRIPALLPDDAIIAHKTGSLEGVANDVGIVTWQNRQFILAVRTDDQPDTLRTNTDIAILADHLLRAIAAHA